MGVLIVAMVLGFTLIVVKMGLDYSKSKLQELNEAPGDATLLMSELEELIASSVAEAVEPLQLRIEELESLQLPEADAPKQLSVSESMGNESDSHRTGLARKSHSS